MGRPHKQLILNANINKHFDSTSAIKDYLTAIIKEVEMDLAAIPGNPMGYYCNDITNTGYTGVAILETSHLAIHTWDEEEPNKIRFDLYSCSDFTPEQVLAVLEPLELSDVSYFYFDRDNLPDMIGKVYG